MESFKKKKGFTLIELLVVIAILGILATIGLRSFVTVQIKGRDAKRKHDLGQIQKALEMYYNDYGIYPEDDDLPASGLGWTEEGTVFMKEMPGDPKDPTQIYVYEQQADGAGYILYARLENSNDSCFESGVCKDYSVDCNTGKDCNYAVSSPNINP